MTHYGVRIVERIGYMEKYCCHNCGRDSNNKFVVSIGEVFCVSAGDQQDYALYLLLHDGVQLSLGTETFPDRVYGETLFPAGEYDALCVRIGPAAGHNWWCVLFPPLCIVSDTGEPIDLDTVEPESVLWNWLRSLL
jgi:hypothetical protein